MTIKTGKHKIISSKQVAEIFTKILMTENHIDQDKEHLWTMGLDSRNHIKYIELVSLGILNSAVTHPREIFRFAIQGAVASLIVCHNHPSGDTEPSDIDIGLTKRLVAAGNLLGIPVLDHVIISLENFYSFCDSDKI